MVAITDEQLGATSWQSERRERRFPWSFRGYRRSAVDHHISELEREIDRYGPAARPLAFDLFDRIAAMWSDVRVAREPSLG